MTKTKKYIRDGRAPIPEKESTSKTMSAIRDRNTKPELILRKALWHSGIRGYRVNWKKAPGKPDIAFPGKKLAIFVNGCFWHRCPYCSPPIPKSNTKFWKEKFRRNVERDKQKLKYLHEKGWDTLVVWECQIKENVQSSFKKIKELLNEKE
jgi:DNA mismatch endonuclease (patch repair protein)